MVAALGYRVAGVMLVVAADAALIGLGLAAEGLERAGGAGPWSGPEGLDPSDR